MKNWYLYYRLLTELQASATMDIRMGLQDVLCDLRAKANKEWPSAPEQYIQDHFEWMARVYPGLSEKQARAIVLDEEWSREEGQ